MPRKAIDLLKSYRINDRRSSSGYVNRVDHLFAASQRNGERKYHPPADRDTHSNVTNYGRRILMTLGRVIYGNVPTVAGAIVEQAALSAEVFIPQYYGADRAWGDAAEDWLLNWNKICDVAGPPYDFDSYLELIRIANVRDGDMGTLLTETPDGYPQIQVLPGHLIGPKSETIVEDGDFRGLPINDGVILSPQRRALAYRVYESAETFQDVPAQNMFLSFIPEWSDQVRGFSKLACAILDLQAFRDSRDNELLAQIACSANALIEENETGQLDTAKASVFGAPRAFDSTTKQLTTPTFQSLEGGQYRYLKAGSGSKVTPFHYDRPGANVIQYQENVVRDAFRGFDWDYYFSVDPSKVGGASLRIIVDKINRALCRIRRMQKKAAARIHGYALSKAMKLGLLPWNDDWWKWTYQTAAKLTADAKYDSDVSIQELSNVVVSPQRVCGERGEYWEDVQDEWLDAQARFQAQAKAKSVDLTLVKYGTASTTSNQTAMPATDGAPSGQ
jgi:lambda family portal protein